MRVGFALGVAVRFQFARHKPDTQLGTGRPKNLKLENDLEWQVMAGWSQKRRKVGCRIAVIHRTQGWKISSASSVAGHDRNEHCY